MEIVLTLFKFSFKFESKLECLRQIYINKEPQIFIAKQKPKNSQKALTKQNISQIWSLKILGSENIFCSQKNRQPALNLCNIRSGMSFQHKYHEWRDHVYEQKKKPCVYN